MKKFSVLYFILALILSYNTGNGQSEIEFTVQQNPFGFSPLASVIALDGDYDENTYAVVNVKGKPQTDADITLKQELMMINGTYYIPVIGLYPAYNNEVEVELRSSNSRLGLGTINTQIKTDSLIFDFVSKPEVTGEISNESLIFMVLYTFVFEKGKDMDFIQKSVGLDKNGDIRWYGDFQGRSHIVTEYIDGYLYAGSNKGIYSDKIIKYNLLGQELDVYDISMDGQYYNTHHDIRVNAKGNLLLTVNKKDHPSMENIVMEYDMKNEEVVNILDLENCMPNVDDIFVGLPFSAYANKKDYIHINGIYPDDKDNSIIVSSRHAGVCEIDGDDGEMKWFIFPHVVKGKARDTFPKKQEEMQAYFSSIATSYREDGNEAIRKSCNGKSLLYDGKEQTFEDVLLTPIDADGRTIKNDKVVLYGDRSDDFSFPLRQHSPYILKNGNLAMFDNGDANMNKVSRAVEYEIIEDEDKTGGQIKQVWEFVHPENEFAQIVGNISELENGNRLINFGAINYVIGSREKRNIIGNIIEVTSDYPAVQTFNLKVELPNKSVVYRASKLDLNSMSY